MVGGGAIEFLSELHLSQDGFTVKHGEVYFQREFNASALTGSGDFVVGEDSIASLGIESSFVGEGSIYVFGKVVVPELASVLNGKIIVVHKGGKLDVAGSMTKIEEGQVVYVK